MRISLLLASLCLAGASSGAQTPAEREADLAFTGGRVHTMGTPAIVSALAVRRGKIAFTGSDEEVRSWIGPRTTVVPLKGRAVLPGFIDSHVHPIAGGIELGECPLGAAGTPEELLELVRICGRKKAEGWVRGSGWDLTLFAEGNPSKSLLDSLLPGRPVYLEASDGHSAWANSKALSLAGLTRTASDPPNGRVEREASGEPSGVLREDAMELVSRLLPEYTLAESTAGLRRALDMAARLGITTLHEAAADESMLAAYADLDRRGELSARINASFELRPSSGVLGARALPGLRRRYQGKLLRLTGAKVFVDGVLEARTAALLEPYADRGGLGTAGWDSRELADTAAALDREGFQLHAHAIGDRAVRMSLDAVAEARKRNGPGGPPHHLAHLELIDPADLPRFKGLRVMADFQPFWANRDPYITSLTEPGLGSERSGRLYPLGDAFRAGAPLACGSDWSVSSMNPWEAIQVGLNRRGVEEGAGPAWLPAQALDLDTLLRCYTTGGAAANLQETLTGRLEPGFAADLIVLDKDP
ncbi:MAG: amidohydrolase, partial [Elusimicrobiota bacterium]